MVVRLEHGVGVARLNEGVVVSLKLASTPGAGHDVGVVHVTDPAEAGLITREVYFHKEVLRSGEGNRGEVVHLVQTCTPLGVVRDPHYPMNCWVHLKIRRINNN